MYHRKSNDNFLPNSCSELKIRLRGFCSHWSLSDFFTYITDKSRQWFVHFWILFCRENVKHYITCMFIKAYLFPIIMLCVTAHCMLQDNKSLTGHIVAIFYRRNLKRTRHISTQHYMNNIKQISQCTYKINEYKFDIITTPACV